MRHDLTLRVPGFEIPAALEIPDGPPENISGAVLLIPGSLFSNVDGDYPAWNIKPRVYAYLAEQMSARGIAVYRFAKLGPGTGSVEVPNENSPSLKTWKGRAVIAHAALAQFRAELAVRKISPRKLMLAGHSEGAVVASVIAAEGATCDAVVLLSGPSVGILSIMIEQAEGMVYPGASAEPVALLRRVVAHLRASEPIPDDLRAQVTGSFGAGALVSMPPEAQAYMRDCDATDPAATIAVYEKPVLIIQGGSDTSVPAHHAETLRDARGARPTTYKFFPGLTHMYKQVPPGTSPQAAFALEGPTDPAIAAAVDEFVRAL